MKHQLHEQQDPHFIHLQLRHSLLWSLLTILLFTTAIFAPRSAWAAALTSVSNIPWSSDILVTGKHTIKFTTATSVPADGKIVITYPSGFDVSSATFDSSSGFDGGKSIDIAGQVITVTRDGDGSAAGAGAKYLVLDNITNHASAGSSHTVTVETQDSGGGTLDGPTTSANFATTGTGDGLDTTAPWPTFQHDSRNTGASSLSGPEYPTLSWLYNTSITGAGPRTYITASQDTDGTVYIGDGVSANQVIALNPDGTVKWTYTLPSGTFLRATISENGNVYIRSTSQVIALDAATGALQWSVNVSFHEDGNLQLGSDGTIYTPSNGSGLYALNSDGTIKWISTAVPSDRSKVAVDGSDRVVITNNNYVAIVNPDGTVFAAWGGRGTQDTPIFGANGNVFFRHAYYTNTGSTIWSTAAGGDYQTDALSPDEDTYYNNNGGLSAYNVSDGSLQWTASVAGAVWNARLSTDGRGRVYRGGSAFDADGNQIWKMTHSTSFGSTIIGANSTLYMWAYGKLFAVKPWTLSGSLSDDSFQAGDTITITATSSMLKRDPAATVDNQVQAVVSNGDKVTLTYDSVSGSNTVWKGTYTIPEDKDDGTLTFTLQAAAYNVTTDITTEFDSLPSGFNNTGLTASLSSVVDMTNPSSSATAVQITSGGKTFDKYLQSLNISDLSSVGDNDHPMFCFTKAYDTDGGSGISSYTVRVDGQAYLSDIPDSAPSLDEHQTRSDGDHAIIKETDEYYYRYKNFDRPSETQEICVYGKGDAKKLSPGIHAWNVRVADRAGNSSSTETRRFLVQTSIGSYAPDPSFWFPLTVLQIGNLTNIADLTTVHPRSLGVATTPYTITTPNPTFYGIANMGTKMTIKLEEIGTDSTTGELTRTTVATHETTVNPESRWGINFTPDITSLTPSKNYYATVIGTYEDKVALIKDIPIRVSTRTSSVLGTEDEGGTGDIFTSEKESEEPVKNELPELKPTPSPTPLPVMQPETNAPSGGIRNWFQSLF